jgi:hypothetical protein
VTLLIGRFDHKLYAHFLNEATKGSSRRAGDAYSTYAYYPQGCGSHLFSRAGGACDFTDFFCPRPHCDRGRRPGHVAAPNAVAAFPVRHIEFSLPCRTSVFLLWFLKGGSVKRLFGGVRV